MARMTPAVPRHREAFPRLDIHAALASFRLNRPICVFTDQAGRKIGVIRVRPTEDAACLTVWGELCGQNVVAWGGVMDLALTSSPTGIDPLRKLLLCPRCGRPARTISRFIQWACPGCDGLLSRSQLVHSKVRLRERLEELDSLIKYGRPKGMHQRTYDRHRDQAADIRKKLDRQRLTMPCPEHSRRVTSYWQSEQRAYQDPTLRLYSIPDCSPPRPTVPEEDDGSSRGACAELRHFDPNSLFLGLPSDEDFPDGEGGSLFR